MKFLQKIANFIALLVALLFAFVIFCHFNPDVSERLGDFLQKIIPEKQVEETVVETETDASGETGTETGSESAVASPLVVQEQGNALGNPMELAKNTSEGLNGATTSDYVGADKENVKAPEDRQGLSGYQELEGTGHKTTEAPNSGYGETGENLSFDTSMYPYYAMLNDDGKKLYKQIYANASVCNPTFQPIVTTTPGMLFNVYTAVDADHPELFWLDSTSLSYCYGSSGNIDEIYIDFLEIASDLDTAKKVFQERANEFLAKASGQSYEKQEEIIHDALVDFNIYDLNSDYNQSAYSAMVNGSTVCAGYAKAFQYLMQQLGVPTYYCVGYAGEMHAWNIIKLDGEYYNVDVTWADTDPSNYTFFNKTDNDYKDSHLRMYLSVNLPACNGTKYHKTENERVTDNSVYIEKDGAYITVYYDPNEEVHNAEEYYELCLQKAADSADINSATFAVLIPDKSFYDTMIQMYKGKDRTTEFKEFLSKLIQEKNAKDVDLYYKGVKRDDGKYVLAQEFQFIY